MEIETDLSSQAIESVDALRQEIANLASRVTQLEASLAKKPAPETEPAVLSEELLVTIGAAVAAYLGKKAHIRQIRLDGGTTWVKWGRTTIQASHALAVRHG